MKRAVRGVLAEQDRRAELAGGVAVSPAPRLKVEAVFAVQGVLEEGRVWKGELEEGRVWKGELEEGRVW
jgi:hypothetical protein